jgi:hypothetical protein
VIPLHSENLRNLNGESLRPAAKNEQAIPGSVYPGIVNPENNVKGDTKEQLATNINQTSDDSTAAIG